MPTAVSAPGKVLLAGGYLVLDREYSGLVFGLSARIHVLVDDIKTSSGVQLSEIVVQSPQFRDATWIYGYHLAEDQGGIAVTQLQGASNAALSKNIFVETALAYTLTYITSVLPHTTIKPVKVTILADNDYYSQPSSSTTPLQTSSSTSKFTDFKIPLSSAHKTGLGSSAALVTSLTASLLTHYLPSSSFSLSNPTHLQILHNLSQAIHCSAQGKVGSGFDIAAAVYGTCLYRRFSPSLLSSLGSPSTASFATRLRDLIEEKGGIKWDTEIRKDAVIIPKGMALVMCDVDCGSQTVSMVKSVLSWRSSSPEVSKKLWDELQTHNTNLARFLTENDLEKIPKGFGEIREKIREMGVSSGVQIEPPEQTELLDAVTHDVEGVEGGVVPGAGGYDAVVLLVKDDEKTSTDLNAFLEMWSAESKGRVRLLGARGELEGVRVERGEGYGEWVD